MGREDPSAIGRWGVVRVLSWDDGYVNHPTRPLAIAGCLNECAWSATGDRLGDDPLFACAACGSEWVRSEKWTPIDWLGEVPETVVAERARPD